MRPPLQPLQPTHAASRLAVSYTTVPRVRMVAVAILVLVSAAFATLASAPSPSQAATLASKQAQATKLDAQVSKLELQYDELQERYRGARFELEQVQAGVKQAQIEVKQTRRSLRIAKMRLAQRAIAIYRTNGASNGFVDFASSGSLSNFFDKMETIQRVSLQDAGVLVRVDELNAAVEKKEQRLKRAQARAAVAAKRAERDKKKMGAVLAVRQEKLSSVNADIRAIMEAQRAAAARRAAAAARETAALADATESKRPDTGGSSGNSGSADGGGGSGSSIPLPPGSGTAAAAANAAMGKIGSPYVWAASGPSTFDCSGLVIWAFAQAGRPGLPHSTYALVGMGVDVPLNELQVGDLVFSASDGHMGIYVGNGSFVHAPHSGDVVKVTSMSDYRLHHARRI